MFDNIHVDAKYSAGHVAPYPLTLVKGKGAYVFDACGKGYLDMVTGIAVVNFGHSHPRLVQALYQQAHTLAVTSRLFHTDPLSALLKRACILTGMDKAIPMNSGAEAVETAIKVIRKWGYLKKNVPKECAEILVCGKNFHGRTVTTVGMSSNSHYKAHFGPFTPGFKTIPYNDIKALRQEITPNTVGFIVEPIQGEAGVVLPDFGYLKACQTLCHAQKVMFICDEIQTGIGRTGKFLAMEHEQVQPDGVLLGKALGGGLLPISLFLAKDHLMEVITPGDHGSTFGGNALACKVAYEALNTLFDENLHQNAQALGQYFLTQLSQINSPIIKEVRGKGLLIGIEIHTQQYTSKDVSDVLIEKGLLNINTQNKVIRLLPPLNITKQQIDDSIKIIIRTLESLESTQDKKNAPHMMSESLGHLTAQD